MGPLLVVALAFSTLILRAQEEDRPEIRVENHFGDVAVQASIERQFELRYVASERRARADDVEAKREGQRLIVRAGPSDGARVNIELIAPFDLPVYVETRSGKITFEGFPALFTARTVDGAVEATAPWEATRFLMMSGKKPDQVDTPKGFKFRQDHRSEIPSIQWVLADRRKDDEPAFGRIRIRSESSDAVTLKHVPIPRNSPVKMTWQAEEIAERLLDRRKRPRVNRDSPEPDPGGPVRPQAPAGAGEEPPTDGDGVVFSSDVRMVNISAAVYDAAGRPITGLTAEDFEVIENGEPQKISAAASEEAPFNLALLLDMSFSTRRNRAEMEQAARGFINIARERDRVALHALANNWFVVLSHLTANREGVLKILDSLPQLAGGSPIYDSVLLSYAEEFEAESGSRNALIVVTDGVDNRLYGIGLPSAVSFGKLLKAAEAMDALIYPIFLGPAKKLEGSSVPAKALEQLEELAAATGGRVFEATSMEKMEGVYDRVAEELRSVYGVAYYPRDQDFDGSFRPVEVRVKRPNATVRARSGYVAR